MQRTSFFIDGLRLAACAIALMSAHVGSWAEPAVQPAYSSIGRVQLSHHNTGVTRLSESYFVAAPSRLFLLEALDYQYNVRDQAFDNARFQVFFGGPLAVGDNPQLFGWVTRLDYLYLGNAAPTGPNHLADARLGGQLTVQQIGPFSEWFKRNKAELFIQVFPLRTNRDFGVVDTFTRFSKRFSPHFVARGVVRTYHFPSLTVATFETDFVYDLSRRHDVFFRIGKSSRDYTGLAQKDFLFGVGVRMNF